MWEAFASPVTGISLLLSEVTHSRKKAHPLTNVRSQAKIRSQLFLGPLVWMGRSDSKANGALQRNTLQKGELLPRQAPRNSLP